MSWIRYILLVGALVGALWGVVEPDAVFAALMGISFGFQLAMLLVDRALEQPVSKLSKGVGR